MFALDTLEKLKTFKERIHFAENNLKVIGTGTSRIVFEYGDKVFKLAKNRKGIMQNKIEILKSKSNSGIERLSISNPPLILGEDVSPNT